MNTAQNKKLLQDQALDLGKQVAQLTTSKSKLEGELTQITAAIETREQAISAAMLAGTDYSKDLDNQQRDKTKAESLRGAIAQASKKLEELSKEQYDNARNFGMLEILSVNDDLEKGLLACFEKLRIANSAFEDAARLVESINSTAGRHSMEVIHIDGPAQTLKIFYHVREWFVPGNESIPHKMEVIESSYPAKLADMRAKFQIK